MVLMGGDCRIVGTNAAFSRITGAHVTRSSATRWNFTHPYLIPNNRRAVSEVEASQGPVAFEKRYTLPEGGDIWVRMTLTKANHHQVLAVVEDVDVRRRAQEALRESEERFRAIVDMTPECVKLVAADGTVLYVNSAGLAMLGAPSSEGVIGACYYEIAAAR